MASDSSNRWKTVRSISEGGQAHIFVVTDRTGELAGEFILKRLKNLDRLQRFKREFEITRTLVHPNIVRVVDADLDRARPFIVTEYCTGGTLQYDKSADAVATLKAFLLVCEGVGFAHEKGVVHRDIKPENVFLRTAGEPVVGDFGICYVEEGERFTMLEEVVGPRFFACPEVRDGGSKSVSRACDIYSLGKLLHFLFTGKHFDRENFRDEPFNLTNREGGYFLEHINNLLDRMITARESDRFSHMREVIAGVKEVTHLIDGQYNPLTGEQGCRYCGKGIYRSLSKRDIKNLGLSLQVQALQALQCSNCGNVQLFYLNDVKDSKWLPSK